MKPAGPGLDWHAIFTVSASEMTSEMTDWRAMRFLLYRAALLATLAMKRPYSHWKASLGKMPEKAIGSHDMSQTERW